MRRRILAVVVAVATALALTACAGLPTTGPVTVGLSGGESGTPDFVLKPDSPQPGATPQEIVAGFLRAGSGPAGGWAVAREFLTPDNPWRPLAGVIIDAGEREPTQLTEDTVSITLTQTAQVDARGAYAPTETGSTTLDFQLVQSPGGEWRISKAPDGIVLSESVFPNIYHRYSLMFFDPTWTYLVPDVRWFPTTTAATRITNALFEGQSPWLDKAVLSAVPDSISPDSPVPVVSGVAQVELGPAAVSLDRVTLDRIQTQLEASLAAAGVSEVTMTAAGTPLDAERVPTASTAVGSSALVLTAQAFGFLSADSVDPIPGLSDAVLALPSAPTAIQVAASQTEAAARLTSGTVVRVRSEAPFAEVDARPGVVDPTIDRYGWIWTVPRDAPGALWATGADGPAVVIQNPWVGASAVTAVSMSRDGTRLAALVEVGGRTMVWVKGVIRTTAGVPTGLGAETLEAATVAGGGLGLTWLDDATLGVLTSGEQSPATTEQPVGGPGSTVAAPLGSTAISGASSTATVRLRNAAGALFVKRGTNWNQTAAGVVVLATQQGSPR